MGKKINPFEQGSGFNLIGKTTAPRCQNGHQWTYSGNLHLDLEGMPCMCGKVFYHTETCKHCGSVYQKHIPNG